MGHDTLLAHLLPLFYLPSSGLLKTAVVLIQLKLPKG